MRRLVAGLLAFACLTFPLGEAGANDSLQDWAEDTENLWRTGSGAHDGSTTAIATSIIGWGVGLALAIAILAAVLHQSKAGSGHSHCDG